MRELSMHILDLAQNSIAAGASLVLMEVEADTNADKLSICISDNGTGMSEELLSSVKDPFTTTRTTRRVGLGIPMIAEAAKACEGDVIVDSEVGRGTVVASWFKLSHIDRAPLGDVASTIVALVAPNPDVDFVYTQRVDGTEFTLDTRDIKNQLDGVPINEPAVLSWLRNYVAEKTTCLVRID